MLNSISFAACLTVLLALSGAEADVRRYEGHGAGKIAAKPIKYLVGSAVKTQMMSDPPQPGSTTSLFLKYGMGKFDYWPQVDCYQQIRSVKSSSIDRTVAAQAIKNAYTATIGPSRDHKHNSAWGFFTIGGTTRNNLGKNHLIANFDYYDLGKDRHFRLKSVYVLDAYGVGHACKLYH